MLEYISFGIMGLGLIFMFFGIVGIMQPNKDFYYRLLVTCKIDTVGIITFSIGVAVRHGISFFTGKILLIVIIMLILNPLVTHMVARSAYRGGYVSKEELEKRKE